MKLRTMILLSGLLLAQTLVVAPAYASKAKRRWHRADLMDHDYHERARSVSPIVTGYVEDDFLILSFSYPLEKVPLRIVDAESGETVFDGVVSGSTLSIPLERDSESFDVYIN